MPGSSGPQSPTPRSAARWRPTGSLVERRFELLLGRGAEAAEELDALTREVAALTAGLEVSEADRLARLDAIAELAARVVAVERGGVRRAGRVGSRTS